MLWYFIPKYYNQFLVIILVCCFLQCHTVTPETKPKEYISDETSFLSLVSDKIYKRDVEPAGTEEKIIKTQNSSNSDDKAISVASTSNPTLPVVKQHTTGEFNKSQSLPTWMATIKSGALERTGFVALGFMLIIVVFFILRAIRVRHKRSKSRKYGIITSTDMEMEPLDKDDDDEEDTTLFDAQQKYTLP